MGDDWMSNDGVNNGRRRFLVAATSVVGAAGVVGVAVPFVGSWFPSARAKAAGAPVKVNVSKIEPGQQIDRKSTRLNSSHVRISYAVFCLKKKKPCGRDGWADRGH